MIIYDKITYTVTLTPEEQSDIMYNYTMDDNYKSADGIMKYIRDKYHAEYYPFRRELVFHDEKYYNWYILQHE